MKFWSVFLLLIFFQSVSFGESSLFVGPELGDTTYNPSDGTDARSNVFTYGGEVFYVLNHWALGANFLYSDLGSSGTSLINVHPVNQWYEGELRFRLWTDDFSPYALVGLGALTQNVTTTVSGQSETSSGTFAISDVGIGFLGRLSNYIGIDISAKYYQYSNVNGFNYAISIGYFPLF